MKFCFQSKDFIEENILPDHLAVIDRDTELTWNQFAKRVNDMCSYFQEEDLVSIDHPVILHGHKSVNMLVAMYALMKMEVEYIPVDIIYPKDRIEKIKKISKSQLVVNTTSGVLGLEGTKEIALSHEGLSVVSEMELTKNRVRKDDPTVYIIFTSGSTGEPKGVQITTEAVQSFTRWMTGDFGYTNTDVFVNSAVLSFDLSVFEVMTFGALGATLMLNDKEAVSDPNILLDRIEKYNGSVWVSTPSFALIYSRLKEETRLNSIRSFLFCGEVLPNELAKKLIENFPQAKVINTYGPTEATVATTYVEIDEEIIEKHNPLPVGTSKRESKLILEDEEIIIQGPNVSIGYMGNPELNAQKFTTIEGQRAFKTGDKGYLENGMLFFKGREDDLVKLHGYRIELNEINSVACDLDYIEHAESLALKRNGSVKKIVMMIKMASGQTVEVSKLKEDLLQHLPHYMIPSDFRFIETIPLTQNGKIDKKELQEMYLKKR